MHGTLIAVRPVELGEVGNPGRDVERAQRVESRRNAGVRQARSWVQIATGPLAAGAELPNVLKLVFEPRSYRFRRLPHAEHAERRILLGNCVFAGGGISGE